MGILRVEINGWNLAKSHFVSLTCNRRPMQLANLATNTIVNPVLFLHSPLLPLLFHRADDLFGQPLDGLSFGAGHRLAKFT